MKGLIKTKRFIKDNALDFTAPGSALNSNATVLAGFICFILEKNGMDKGEGELLIDTLELPLKANIETQSVFQYAWYNEYEEFWKTKEAKEQYIF